MDKCVHESTPPEVNVPLMTIYSQQLETPQVLVHIVPINR